MPFVAELYGLLACDVDFGYPRRCRNVLEQPEQRRNCKDCSEDAESGDGVGTAVEDLRHRSGDPRIAQPLRANSEPTDSARARPPQYSSYPARSEKTTPARC